MDQRFNYMLLDRLRIDCEYYLGYGGRSPKVLWAGDEQRHIDEMRRQYDLLAVKPEWITPEKINKYAAKMNVK